MHHAYEVALDAVLGGEASAENRGHVPVDDDFLSRRLGGEEEDAEEVCEREKAREREIEKEREKERERNRERERESVLSLLAGLFVGLGYTSYVLVLV